LPREAVTKFLLQCVDCQKRGCAASIDHVGSSSAERLLNSKRTGGDSEFDGSLSPPDDAVVVELTKTKSSGTSGTRRGALDDRKDISFSLPFTTEYLRAQRKQMRLRSSVHADPLDNDEALENQVMLYTNPYASHSAFQNLL